MAWRKVRFKDGVVYARCDDAGRLRESGGRVEIRYRPGVSKAYRAAERNLTPLEDEPILPDDACSDDVVVGGGPRKGGGGRAARNNDSAPPSAPPKDAIVVYTDGACSGNPGPAGVGAVILDGSSRRELSAYLGQATNNIAELTAIGLALEALPPERVKDRPLRVYTDSQYSIGVLQKGWKAKANQELIRGLRRAVSAYPNLQLIYVRGHVGVELNERADALAVEAVQSRRSRDWDDIS